MIKPKAFVRRLNSIDDKVVSAEYVDEAGKVHQAEAKIFVVAAQAIETSRLLLNSANEDFPKGLGKQLRPSG